MKHREILQTSFVVRKGSNLNFDLFLLYLNNNEDNDDDI